MNKAKSKFYANKDAAILESSRDWVHYAYDWAIRKGSLDAILRILWDSYSEGSPSTKENFIRVGKDLALKNGFFEPDTFVKSEERKTGQSIYYAPFLPFRRNLKTWIVRPPSC